MKKIQFIIALFILSGCAQFKVKSSMDPNADIANYNSWCWMNGCNPTFEGPEYLFPKRAVEDLVNAVAEEMYNKGYQQIDDNSDLLVDFHVILKEDSSRSAIIHEEALPMWEQYDHKSSYYHYLDGTLIIDIADRKKGKIIWRSVTKSYLPKYPEMNYPDVQRGIKRALKDFPERTN